MNSEHQKNLEALMLDLLFKSNIQVTQDSAHETGSAEGSIDELNAELSFRKALGRGTGLREDKSFDFEDNLLLQFYRLAHINGYPSVINAFRNDPAESDVESTENSVFSSHPSLLGLKSILLNYAENFELWLLDESLDSDNLLKEIEDRVVGVNLPMYHQLKNMPRRMDFIGTLFDTSVEMAVCAYTAHKLNALGIAWNALMKSRELLGGYMGARSVFENKFANSISTSKAKFMIAFRDDVLRTKVVRYLYRERIHLLKPPVAKSHRHNTTLTSRDRERVREALFNDLSTKLVQLFNLESDRIFWDSNIPQQSVDSNVEMFEGWLKFPNFKEAVERYIDASLGIVGKEELEQKAEDSESNYVLKSDVETLLENIDRTVNLHLSAYHQQCPKKKCPMNRAREASTKKLKTYLADPLFSGVKNIKNRKDKEVKLRKSLIKLKLNPGTD
ncbi:hypothetical protein [Thiomicrorhabdus sp. 6S3-12]|uniref:hypothetical protein n=1 Tax=Thiomicrorhabdus sp. 6S3-12 TaxID=2819681 RepID=UPI001AACC7BE|nr:hypothetical protein [Thiomicrorhabdus sp. 6S3-12]MBO1923774.1 hypothetical protein [Thiomicrorhabdus sp. 6S3-12]